MTETTDNGPGPYDLRLRSLELALQHSALSPLDYSRESVVETATTFYKFLNFDRSKS